MEYMEYDDVDIAKPLDRLFEDQIREFESGSDRFLRQGVEKNDAGTRRFRDWVSNRKTKKSGMRNRSKKISRCEDMQKRLCLALIIILIACFASTIFGKDAAMPLVIDVRTVQEWNNGHLEGAVLIPYDQIGEKIGSVVKNKSQRIYVYCRTGHRARIAKEALEKMGYKDIINLGSLEDAAKNLSAKL